MQSLRQSLTIALVALSLGIVSSTSSANRIQDIQNRVKDVQNKVNAINGNVVNVKGNVGSIKNNINALPNLIQQQTGIVIDAQTKQMLMEGFAEVQDFVKLQQQLQSEFGDGSPGSACYTLKSELIAMGDLLNSLQDSLMKEASDNLELSIPEIPSGLSADVIQALPCNALLPLYFILENFPIIADLNLMASDAMSQIEQINNLQSDSGGIESPGLITLSSQPNTCDRVLSNEDLLTSAGKKLSTIGSVWEQIGKRLTKRNFIGKLPASDLLDRAGGTAVGIHGYLETKIEPSNRKEKLAQTLLDLGPSVSNFGDKLLDRVHKCTVLFNQEQILAQQEEILAGQQELKGQLCEVFPSDSCLNQLPRPLPR